MQSMAYIKQKRKHRQTEFKIIGEHRDGDNDDHLKPSQPSLSLYIGIFQLAKNKLRLKLKIVKV